jgi:hypothetical protein
MMVLTCTPTRGRSQNPRGWQVPYAAVRAPTRGAARRPVHHEWLKTSQSGSSLTVAFLSEGPAPRSTPRAADSCPSRPARRSRPLCPPVALRRAPEAPTPSTAAAPTGLGTRSKASARSPARARGRSASSRAPAAAAAACEAGVLKHSLNPHRASNLSDPRNEAVSGKLCGGRRLFGGRKRFGGRALRSAMRSLIVTVDCRREILTSCVDPRRPASELRRDTPATPSAESVDAVEGRRPSGSGFFGLRLTQ